MVQSVTNAKEIVVTSNPQGHFHENTLTQGVTAYPGTFVTLNSAGTYDVFSAASGAEVGMHLLREDHLQGKTSTDAYSDIPSVASPSQAAKGAHIYMYDPVPGDKLYCVCRSLLGTGSAGDTHLIGDLLMVETLTGKLIANSGGSHTFECLEALGALVADTLTLVRYNG